MELNSALKLTEIGAIPSDWRVATIAELADQSAPICYGVVQVGKDTPYGIPIVAIKHVKNISNASLHRASRTVEQPYSRSRIREKDVLISIKGTIGRIGVVPEGFKGNISRELARLRLKEGIHPYYVAHQLEANPTQSRITKSIVGTTRLEFSIGALREFLITIPENKFEQHAIAEALSDVDSLVASYDRLVAKKRDVKQAAMQQLLTGQTRLPGFGREWAVKRLGEHLTFLRNGVNSRAELRTEGSVKYVHYGDVHASKDVFMCPDALPYLPRDKAASLDRLEDGDLIFADASEDTAGISKSVEIRNIGNDEVVAGLHTIAIRFDKAVLADGFKGYLQFCPAVTSHLRQLAAGTKVYSTNRGHVASVEMKLPLPEEQTAIATVLSDMDAEIAALEARRDKTRALKQAMMQELLTGRTRLV